MARSWKPMKAYLKPTSKLYRVGSSASTSKTKMKNKRLSTLYSDWGSPWVSARIAK